MVAPFMCRKCLTRFSTNTHLRRHEASHFLNQRHDCFFCEQSFHRKDTARRHAKACPKRRGRPLPQIEKKGKPRKSCDNCAHNKSSCDNEYPCGHCRSNALLCAYTRVSVPFQQLLREVPSSEQEVRVTDVKVAGNLPAPSMDFTDTLIRARIPFLLNYYDINNTFLDMYPALDTRRAEATKSPSPPLLSELPNIPPEVAECYLDEDNLYEDGLDYCPFMWFDNIELGNHETTRRAPVGLTNHQAHENFAQRSQEVLQELTPFANCSSSRLHLENAIGQDLFSAENMSAFAHLYVQHSHRHCPILHLPTFQAQHATVPLLLAIFLGGSLHSYPRDTYYLAVDCFDIAEAYLFSLPVFKPGYKNLAPSELHMSERHEALKAAVILLHLQIGRNDPEIRQRVRYQRFPMLVQAARSASLFSSRHHDNSPLAGARTSDYQKESLIRTAAYILLLDSQFVVCLRSPPMITILELTGDLPCNEVMFSHSYSSSLANTPRSPSLVEIIDLLMDGAWDGPSNPSFNNIGVFGLFIVISGLHLVIFSAFASRTMQQLLPPLHRALSRWKLLWERLMSRISIEEVELAGFMTCANEVWLIAKVLLRTDSQEFFSGFDSQSLQPFNYLLRRVSEVSDQ